MFQRESSHFDSSKDLQKKASFELIKIIESETNFPDWPPTQIDNLITEQLQEQFHSNDTHALAQRDTQHTSEANARDSVVGRVTGLPVNLLRNVFHQSFT